jgi:hypothetical protein
MIVCFSLCPFIWCSVPQNMNGLSYFANQSGPVHFRLFSSSGPLALRAVRHYQCKLVSRGCLPLWLSIALY